MTTIKDIAKASGVSPATVSYVLNNGPRSVLPQTRERILRTIRELDYHPSAVARGLTRKRMDSIGVIFPKPFPSFVANPYVGQLIDGVLTEAVRRHQNVILYTGRLLSDGRKSISVYSDGRCDGLIVVSPLDGDPTIIGLLGKDIPFVVIGTQIDDPLVSFIDIDNRAGAYDMVTYLIGLGHRRIAYLSGELFIQSAALRLLGYRSALEDAGVQFRPDLVLEGLYWPASGYDRTLALLDRPPGERPTALFCGSDEIALGALKALRERKVAVPREMSLAGFDDIAAAAAAEPALTTIRQALFSLGERAAAMIFARIANRDLPSFRELVLGELIVRDSTAPPQE